MLFGKLAFALSFVAVGFASPIAKRELPESFTTSLKGIGSYLSETNALIKAFPKHGGTRDQAKAIGNKLTNIYQVESAFHALQDATPVYKVTPEDEAEIKSIIFSFVPIVSDLIKNLNPLRPAFDATGIEAHEIRDDISSIQLNIGFYMLDQLQYGRNGVQGVSQETVDKFKDAFLPLFTSPSQVWW